MTLLAIDANERGDIRGWDTVSEGVEWRRRYEVGGQAIVASVRLRLFAHREGGIWRATARVEDGWTYWGASFVSREDAVVAAEEAAARGAPQDWGASWD